MSDDALTESPISSADDMIGSVLSRLSSGDFADGESDEDDDPIDSATEDADQLEAEDEEEEVEIALLTEESEGIDDPVRMYLREIGKVYQALFISWNELDFLRRKGADELEAKLEKQDADPCSLRRPSCV